MPKAWNISTFLLLIGCVGSVAAAPIGSSNAPWLPDAWTAESPPEPIQEDEKAQLSRWLQRGHPYLSSIREQVLAAGLPSTFAYLPLIESGFVNDAVSPKGAAGLWQLMPATARQYGLRVDRFVDERKDPAKATKAAIEHLRDLTQQFGSPSLVAAAYNAGAGRIAESLKESDADSFEQLVAASMLPSETAAFVPRLLAAAQIAEKSDRYGVAAPVTAATDCDSVVVTRSVWIADVARAVDLPPATLRSLNPQYIQGKTPPRSRSVIRLPKGKASRLAGRTLASLPDASFKPRSERPLPRHVRVRRGDTIESIAERHQVAENRLRRVNALPEWYRLRPGQILRLPDSQETAR